MGQLGFLYQQLLGFCCIECNVNRRPGLGAGQGSSTWRCPENPERLLRISDAAGLTSWQAYGNSCLSRVCLAGCEGIIGVILHIKPRLSILYPKLKLSGHQGNKGLRLVGLGC